MDCKLFYGGPLSRDHSWMFLFLLSAQRAHRLPLQLGFSLADTVHCTKNIFCVKSSKKKTFMSSNIVGMGFPSCPTLACSGLFLFLLCGSFLCELYEPWFRGYDPHLQLKLEVCTVFPFQMFYDKKKSSMCFRQTQINLSPELPLYGEST